MAETEHSEAPAPAGAVISPGGAASDPVQQPAPTAPAQAQAPPPSQAAPLPNSPYMAESNFPQDDGESITWTASEYIAHQKSASWYGLLALVVAILAAVIFFLTHDKITTGVVILCGIALGGYGARQPRQKQYRLDASGLTIGEKHYDFGNFRYFSIVDEGAFSSIVFMPLKRFATLTTIYYAPEDEGRIIELLSLVLPHEEAKRDPVDSFMSRIRF